MLSVKGSFGRGFNSHRLHHLHVVCLRLNQRLNGQTGSYRALRGGDGSRHSLCRFRVLQKPILGTADSQYWNRPGVRSVLFEISEASVNKGDSMLSLRLCRHTSTTHSPTSSAQLKTLFRLPAALPCYQPF